MTRMRRFEVQLQDMPMGSDIAGPSVGGTGGKMLVTANGSQKKATLYNADGSSLSQPLSFTAGKCTFHTLDTIESVDLFGYANDGRAFTMFAVKADAISFIPLTRAREQVMVIPFHIDDFAATVETDTGFDMPTPALFKADGVGINVVTIDATETIDVGTATSESGDPDGLISAASVGTAGVVADNGALYSSGAPAVSGGKSIVITTTAGSDTGTGYVFLPYQLMNYSWPTP